MPWEGRKNSGKNCLVSPEKEVPQVMEEEVEGRADEEKTITQAKNRDQSLLCGGQEEEEQVLRREEDLRVSKTRC